MKHWLYGSVPGFAGRFPYFGSQVYFPPKSKSFLAACEQGIFESDIVETLRRLVRPGTHLFDVGGNIGLMALPVLASCPSCKVVSFEPSPSSLPYLERTVAGSGYRDRWTVVAKALGEKVGQLEFVVGDPADSLFEGLRSERRVSRAKKILVESSTVDSEWERLGRPEVSVMKIDVEGAERMVLDGSTRLLADCGPHLVLEWYAEYLMNFGTPLEYLLGIAKRFGYNLYSIPYGVPVTDAKGLEVQMLRCSNFLLTRP